MAVRLASGWRAVTMCVPAGTGGTSKVPVKDPPERTLIPDATTWSPNVMVTGPHRVLAQKWLPRYWTSDACGPRAGESVNPGRSAAAAGVPAPSSDSASSVTSTTALFMTLGR
jgi:hypothetical protein